MALIIHLLAATLCLIHLSTGDECRLTKSVYESVASLQYNVYRGGHVWKHIPFLKEKPKGAKETENQNGESMFESEAAFYTAFGNLMISDVYNFAQCPNNGGDKTSRRDVVRGPDIGVDKVYHCRGINDKGLCSNLVDADNLWNRLGKLIVFDYNWIRGRWVLRTAWPNLFNKKIKPNPARNAG